MIGKTNSINTIGGNTLKNLLDATKSCSYLFYNYSGTSVNDLISQQDTDNVSNMDSMFKLCTKLKNIPLLNTSNVSNMNEIFYGCHTLTSIPLFNTSKVKYLSGAFSNCSSLKVIPAWDVSKCTSLNNIFYGCTSLEEIHATGWSVNFDISASSKFTRAALIEILNNLIPLEEEISHWIRISSSSLALLTEADKEIATNKNWTIITP